MAADFKKYLEYLQYTKPVLKFLKGQFFLVACAAVVLLALGALVWPFGGWADELRKQMTDRSAFTTTVQGLSSQTLDVPGLPLKPGEAPPKGVITQPLIDMKQAAMRNMADQKTQITEIASEENERGRVVRVPNNSGGFDYVPLLGGKPTPGFIPNLQAGVIPHVFRAKLYPDAMAAWVNKLTGREVAYQGPPELAPGKVPTRAYLHNQFLDELKKSRDNQPKIWNDPSSGQADVAAQKQAEDAYVKNAILTAANQTKIYIVPERALQRRSFINDVAAPTNMQMFEAFVDCWHQQDIVDSIAAINSKSHNVGESPIKNLLGMTVGGSNINGGGSGSGTTGSGGLFFTGGAAPAPAPGAPPGTATPGVNPSRSMTGRVGNDKYDVVLVSVSMVIDPAYINAFIAELYRRNNGYTVLNVRQTAVDPYDAASKGFLYGHTQVVQVDIVAESLIFHGWASKVTPANYVGSGANIVNQPPVNPDNGDMMNQDNRGN